MKKSFLAAALLLLSCAVQLSGSEKTKIGIFDLLSYNVPAASIVAIWGMESNYGPNQGEMQVVRSLATLAYAGKRPSYFRGELIAALHILAKEHMSAKDLKGSWAGAAGSKLNVMTSTPFAGNLTSNSSVSGSPPGRSL